MNHPSTAGGVKLLESPPTRLARLPIYDLLAPVYGWFTRGFDTPDLTEAKALLDALA